MDVKNNTNEFSENKKLSDNVSDSQIRSQTNEQKPAKRIRRQATPEQLANPFHGVKLKEILERLVAFYGWEYLGARVNINCFKYDPTMKSSLGFLRRTQWAREHVEDVFLEMLEDQKEEKKKDS